MILPYMIKNIPQPAHNSHKIDEYCNNILKELETTEKSNTLFSKIAEVIDNSGININDRDTFKLQSTNETLLKPFKQP